ncbi:MAG: hypothetical protein AB7E85_01650 [Pseudobdellovibrionaceae bacterium]
MLRPASALFTLTLTTALWLGLPAPAHSAELRGEDKSGYSRIVLETDGGNPDYTVSKLADGGFTLSVKSSEKVSAGDAAAVKALSRLADIAVSDTDGTLKLTFKAPKATELRQFTTGRRIIVDVYGGTVEQAAGETAAKASPAPEPEAKPAQAEEPERPAEKPAIEPEEKPAVETVKAEDTHAATAPLEDKLEEAKEAINKQGETKPALSAVNATPEDSLEMSPAAAREEAAKAKKVADTPSAVITISGTESFGLTAFKAGNRLFIVMDRPEVTLAPQAAGPQGGDIGGFERQNLEEATIFSAELPDNFVDAPIRSEGGGLVWRIIFGGEKPDGMTPARLGAVNTNGAKSLLWNGTHSGKVIDFEDKLTGMKMEAVTSLQAAEYQAPEREYPQLLVYETAAGFAYTPLADGIEAQITPEGVVISGDGSTQLAVTDTSLGATASFQSPDQPSDEALADTSMPTGQILRFDRWQKGGTPAFSETVEVLTAAASREEEEARVENLMALGKLELSHAYGPEALGYLRLAEEALPALQESPEFMALKGVAATLAGQYARGFDLLNNDVFEDNAEIAAWKTFALAGLQDWKQAAETLPSDISLISNYPTPVRPILALSLAEVALRNGKKDQGEDLLKLVRRDEEQLLPSQVAALTYLEGELARQNGDIGGAITVWKPLTEGTDDLYRAKAGLALTRLENENKQIKPSEAIDRLERLRYAWRGDDLETQIYYRLGQLYIDQNNVLKGLALMRIGASRSPDKELTGEITNAMEEAYKNAFMSDQLAKLSPLEAVSLYDDFSELMPAGQEGRDLSRSLADRLADVELFDRASDLLKDILNKGEMQPLDALETSVQIARVQLQDKKATDALKTLEKSDALYEEIMSGKDPLEVKARADGLNEDAALLKARAYALQKKPDQALLVLSRLPQTPAIVRMRADVAWRAERWDAASEALEELVNLSDISDTTPLTQEQAELLLNWAVTLSLSDNRYVLANLRETYGDRMKATSRADEFEVITRPRQNIFMADRETINRIISDIDIFKDFMNDMDKPSASATGGNGKAPAPTKPEVGQLPQ